MAHKEHGERVMHHSHERAKKAHHGSHHERGYAPSSGFTEGHDEMVGRHDYAGMPPEVKMNLYPKERFPKDEGIDDTMSDIERIEGKSEGKRRKYMSYQK